MAREDTLPTVGVRTLIRGIFREEGLTEAEINFALQVAQRESNLGQNIEPHSDPAISGGAPGTSQGIFQLRTPGLLDTFTAQGFTNWRNPFQEITFVARYIKANRNDGFNGWGPWTTATALISGGANPVPEGPGTDGQFDGERFFNLSFDEIMRLIGDEETATILGPAFGPVPFDSAQLTFGTGEFTIDPNDPIAAPLFAAWADWQADLALEEQFLRLDMQEASHQAGLDAAQSQRDFNNLMQQLATQNNWSIEAAQQAFENQKEVLGLQQEFTTGERLAGQEFTAEQAAKDRELNERLNRLNAETALANTIAQLQESARQQATELIGVDPQRGAIAARGVQSLGRSPASRFQQNLRQFATQELPTPSTSASSLGDIEGNIQSLQDVALPQRPLGAAHGMKKKAGSQSLKRGTGGTAILVGEGSHGEGLRAGTAEVAIFHDDGSAEIIPLAGMAQSGFEFTPGVKTRGTAPRGLARPAGGAPTLAKEEGLPPPPLAPAPGGDTTTITRQPTAPPLAPGEVPPEMAAFVADLFVNENPTAVDALKADQLGMPRVKELILQFGAGLISREQLLEGIPATLVPAGEKPFTTEAQALFPIFERLGLDFVPVGGRTPSGVLGQPAAGTARAGLPAPLGAESEELFQALGTEPTLIREAETGAFFWRNSAGELRKIGDASDLLTAGFDPRQAIELPTSEIRGRVDTVQGIEQGEAFTDISPNSFLSGPIFSPLDEEQNVGIFLPNPNQLAALWPSLSEAERNLLISAYGLAGTQEEELARSISFHTPGGLARGSVGAPRRSGALA